MCLELLIPLLKSKIRIRKVKNKEIYETAGKVFSVVGGFVLESIEAMLPWLIVMFSVVICDLITGCRKVILMSNDFRFSKALRDTMGKLVTYFSFVVMVVFIDRATVGQYEIAKYAILLVCFIEGCSIISNLLKPKGYNFNIIAALSVLGKKVGIDKEDTKEIITKEKEVKDDKE